MKLVLFAKKNGESRVGVLTENQIADVTEAAGDLAAVINGGEAVLARIRKAASAAPAIALSDVRILAPVVPHLRVFCIGLNYKEHAAESKMQTQAVPTVFMKLDTSVVGTDAEVILPKISTQPDYEAELAVVIGKGGYQIKAADWESHVFGYTIVNDVSARDVQLATSQWTLGKSFPTFTPVGPCITTKDAVADPHALTIQMKIDGEMLQDSNTSLLLFRIPQLIEYISGITPLLPGDIISTGTPPGVGLGRTPQRWLKPNETMEIFVSGIGTLRNKTRAEA